MWGRSLKLEKIPRKQLGQQCQVSQRSRLDKYGTECGDLAVRKLE